METMGDDEGTTSSTVEPKPAAAAVAADNSPSLEQTETVTTESEKQEEFVTNVVLESDSNTPTSPPEETETETAEDGDAEQTNGGNGTDGTNNESKDTAEELKRSPLKPTASSPSRSPRSQTGVTSSLSLDKNYVHDPQKIAIKFIFANRDGLNVYVKSFPTDSVHVLKQSLISLWPKELDNTPPESQRIRLICMGKGVLTPDSLTLTECDVPIFTTHPTPINVSVKPLDLYDGSKKRKSFSSDSGIVDNECCCTIS